MKKQSALQRSYNKLRKVKKQYCEGKVNKTAVKAQAANYVKAAVAKGQTKSEATKKAQRVMKGGCTMSSSIAGKKKTVKRRK